MAGDLGPGRWAAEDTSPGAIEAYLRELLKERFAEHDTFAPARVLNLVVVADDEWKGEIQNRLDRVRPQPRIADDPPRGGARAHHAERPRRDERGGRRQERRDGGRHRADHDRVRRTPSGGTGQHRRPAGGDRPGHGGLGPARAPRGAGFVAQPGPDRADRLRERAGLGRRGAARAGALQGGLRRGSRLASLNALARAGGGKLRPAHLARGAAPHQLGDRAPPARLRHGGHPVLRLARHSAGVAGRQPGGPGRVPLG